VVIRILRIGEATTNAQEDGMLNMTKRITVFAPLVAFLIFGFSAPAHAERLHGGFGIGIGIGPRTPFLGVGPYYDPFWGPYYPYGMDPFGAVHPTTAIHVEGVPKQTEVFVDGYFAGTAGTIRTTPGGHVVTLYLPGYRTVTESLYVAPGASVKMQDTLARLAPGDVSGPPPLAARSAAQPPDGTPHKD
jgi:PEGA domain